MSEEKMNNELPENNPPKPKVDPDAQHRSNELKSGHFPTWCPGCGNFSMWTAFRNAAAELEMAPDDTLIVHGIGCAGNGTNFYKTYGFHSLHGRAIPVAEGAKLANPELNVIAMGGDGDMYGIGLSHLIHVARRNIDITVIAHNNQMYSLTTGQMSPTSSKGMVTKSTPNGAIEMPFNPIASLLSAEATFVARAFAGDIPYTRDIYKRALAHRGFSFIDVFQPCVTFNKVNTYEWFRERTYALDDEGHDPSDKLGAYQRAMDLERLAVGVFYEENRSIYADELPQLKEGPLWKKDVSDVDISGLMREFV